MKLHTVYITVNLTNGKFYFGIYKTSNPFDEYLGSGINITNAIKKYGKENFVKLILAIFQSEIRAFELEQELIRDELGSSDCYNIAKGGDGGFDFVNKNEVLLNRKREAIHQAFRDKLAWTINCETKLGKTSKENLLVRSARGSAIWRGQKHSIKTKQILSKMQIGSKNSQFGTCWITNGIDNKKINKASEAFWKEKGWSRGRVLL